jgi:hypothetical protein
MKIRFGTPDNGKSPAIVLGFLALTIAFPCWFLQARLKWTHDLIINSRPSNVTSTIFNVSCGLPYNDYHCSALLKTSNASKSCLNDAEIASICVLPLVSFVLQLITIYELFTLTEVRWQFSIHSLGIASALTFGVITLLFYHDSCALLFPTGVLFFTSTILCILTIVDMRAHDERRRAAHNG